MIKCTVWKMQIGGTLGRRDLVLKMAARFDNSLSEKPLRILDAGCGTGINLKYLQILGDVYGLDISKEALIFSQNRGLHSLICGSADKLPFKNELFDLVLALDVIEHIAKISLQSRSLTGF